MPVFADSDPETGNLSYRTVCEVIDQTVKAIMVVHYAGQPIPINPILSLNLPVVEDAAHAIDSKSDGHYCGTRGRIGVYSFDPIKNLATPDSGGIAIPLNLVDLAKTLRHCGVASPGHDDSLHNNRWWKQDVEHVFPKYTPNDVAAAIGLVQLGRLPALQARRKKIWNMYQEALSRIGRIQIPPEPLPNEQHSYFTYLMLVENRDALAVHLRDKGIYTTLRFHPLHKCSAYRKYTKHAFPGCELLERKGLNLPLHPRLSDTDVETTIGAIKECV